MRKGVNTRMKTGKKMWARALVVVFISIFFAVGVSPAGGYKSPLPRESGAEPYEFMLMTLLQLRLSDCQKHDIALLLKQHQAGLRRVIGEVVEARQRLTDAIDADYSDERTVKEISRRVADCEEELALLKAQIEVEIKGLLTAEQQAILQDMKADIVEKIRERVENRLALLDQWIEDHSGRAKEPPEPAP